MPLTLVPFGQLSADEHRALFVVDYHLNNPPPWGHEEIPQYTGQSTIILSEMSSELRKRFKHCYYRVGGFADIRVVWPMKWPPPAANAYGWLPKLEFGDPGSPPYYNQINQALVGVAVPAFRYVTHEGEHIMAPGDA
jgi:hypothetical protein